ncbi:hypothetical protein LTR53_003361 [Teratosphaeriaceae sp. CCFEE 6253]|nr:hypothetical protein LTR53_003361 [Teratosphaeriaceae sp. CCFEE 6253]
MPKSLSKFVKKAFGFVPDCTACDDLYHEPSPHFFSDQLWKQHSEQYVNDLCARRPCSPRDFWYGYEHADQAAMAQLRTAFRHWLVWSQDGGRGCKATRFVGPWPYDTVGGDVWRSESSGRATPEGSSERKGRKPVGGRRAPPPPPDSRVRDATSRPPRAESDAPNTSSAAPRGYKPASRPS